MFSVMVLPVQCDYNFTTFICVSYILIPHYALYFSQSFEIVIRNPVVGHCKETDVNMLGNTLKVLR